MRRLLLGACLLAGLLVTWPSPAQAQRMHTVQRGQTLSVIARRYRVSVWDLASANGMTPTARIRPGQVLDVPPSGVVYVRPGQTLSHIARDNDCSIEDLTRTNHLRPGANLRVGQRLRLPGHDAVLTTTRDDWGEAEYPGVVRVITGAGEVSLVPLRDEGGRVLERGLEQLGRLMTRADQGPEGDVRLPNPRLGLLLAAASDHFGGRPFIIVSGFREVGGYTRETSRHVSGEAADIRIPGVPNRALWDFCRSIGNTGCGLYPRSVFVHFDGREAEAQWVDWSGPGQRPRYGNLDGPYPRNRRARLRAASVGRTVTRPNAVPLEVEVVRLGLGWNTALAPAGSPHGG